MRRPDRSFFQIFLLSRPPPLLDSATGPPKNPLAILLSRSISRTGLISHSVKPQATKPTDGSPHYGLSRGRQAAGREPPQCPTQLSSDR
jgi:hypothetical protein